MTNPMIGMSNKRSIGSELLKSHWSLSLENILEDGFAGFCLFRGFRNCFSHKTGRPQ